MLAATALLALALALALAFYFYNTRNFKYWLVRGVKHDRPIFMFGNNVEGYLLKKSISQVAEETYWKYPKEKVVGFFRSSRPELVLRDPELIKRVLTVDFAHFYARGLNPHKTVIEPMMRNLFFADGDLWRLLRQRMTPAFTSGKLRAMFPLIVERAERLQARALRAAAAARPLDARDLMARYTTDFIGAVGFGLDADSLDDDHSEFRKLGSKIFTVTFKDAVVAVLKELFPELCKHLRYMSKIERDLIALVRLILKQRNHEPSGRNDFIDLLLECKNKGVIVGESLEKLKPDGSPDTATLELTEELIAAQVFVFFAAGFETSSSATSYTLHQLALHPAAQARVHEELDRVLARHHHRLSYDTIKEMTYLEWTFMEGMRMFPSLGFLIRESVRPYTFPEIGLRIDEGVGIFIPLQALQNDPHFFDDPEQFRPERFSPEEFDQEKNKFVYLPFGDGPRACIGARLGKMQSLAGLAAVLSRFSVSPAPETVRRPLVEPRAGIVQAVRGGLPLLFRERRPLAAA